MISWFSGESQPATHQSDEPPETPAHTFVTRAFKQAIFGTPAPPQTARTQRNRTQSMDERRPHHGSKARHSTHTKASNARPRSNSVDDSPAKPPGILLTPGTGGTRRKSVTFDPRDAKKLAGQRDSNPEQRKGLRPEDFIDPPRPTSGLAQFSERADDDEADVTLDVSKPLSSSGKYWKEKFETLDKTSTHDIRKLKKKEEVAKRFGMSRDSEAQQLEEDLKKEQTRADELQLQVDDYRTRVKSAVSENSNNGRKADPPRRRTKDEIANGVTRKSPEIADSDEVDELRQALAEQRKVASAHLKAKESEISRLKQALEEAESGKRKAEDELSEQRRVSMQHLKNKERDISRLQHELDSRQEAQTSAKRPSTALVPTRSEGTIPLAMDKPAAPLGDPASDIWADAGGADMLGSPLKSPRRRPVSQPKPSDNPDYDAMQLKHSPNRRPSRRSETRERAPLSTKAGATLNVEAGFERAESPRSKALSDERRVAARRRIEERKRTRDMQMSSGVAALGA